MPEYAIYNTSTGFLISTATGRSVDDFSLRDGLSIVEVANSDRQSVMWDNATRTFIPRPAKVVIDRLDDIQSSGDYTLLQSILIRLSARDEIDLLDEIGKLLGRARYRNIEEGTRI